MQRGKKPSETSAKVAQIYENLGSTNMTLTSGTGNDKFVIASNIKIIRNSLPTALRNVLQLMLGYVQGSGDGQSA